MKLTTIAVLLMMASLFTACSDRSGSNTGQTATQMPAVPTGIVHHYICPNNCAGSGGETAGECPVCGTAYAHNDAYHNQPSQQPGQQPTMPPQDAPEIQLQQPTAEPAQNAAGVWHYTCSAGCPGGAGAAGNCPMCGNALQHNQAYHQ